MTEITVTNNVDSRPPEGWLTACQNATIKPSKEDGQSFFLLDQRINSGPR